MLLKNTDKLSSVCNAICQPVLNFSASECVQAGCYVMCQNHQPCLRSILSKKCFSTRKQIALVPLILAYSACHIKEKQ